MPARTESVRPIDLANLCALWIELGEAPLGVEELGRHLARSLPLDAFASPNAVQSAAMHLGFVRYRRGMCVLTTKGLRLGRCQKETAHSLSGEAGLFLLQNIYLNEEMKKHNCASFLLRFRADAISGTMVYERGPEDHAEIIFWMQTLHSVGFLDIEENRASVRKDVLPLANSFLAAIRAVPLPQTGRSQEIGDIAEECALRQEKRRLLTSGYPELAEAVQHISRIDQTAGYDIQSFAGIDPQPEALLCIEVKGTEGENVQFVWTANERRVAVEMRERYWLYCYTKVDVDSRSAVGPYKIGNPADKVKAPGFEVQPLGVFVRKL